MIRFENINIKFNERQLYKDFTIEFEEGKINFIMGESGVGKTTLLHEIKNRLLKENKKVSMVFQENRLIPWKNLYKNLELVVMDQFTKEDREKRILEILNMMGLEEFKGFYPSELSGGMKQRANIARAFIYNGDILLMDEPFKALDIKCKKQIINLTKDFVKKNNKTAIIITHDENEVREIGETLFVLNEEPVKIKKSEKIEIC